MLAKFTLNLQKLFVIATNREDIDSYTFIANCLDYIKYNLSKTFVP